MLNVVLLVNVCVLVTLSKTCIVCFLFLGGLLNSPEPGVEAFAQQQSKTETQPEQERKMSTVMATMWLGTKSGNLYVHSAVGNYKKCLAR